MATREDMDAAIKAMVLPWLREAGFKGSLPHLHRLRGEAADLLGFQFKSSGGSLVIELGRVATGGFDFHGRAIPLAKAKVTYCRHNHRHRLGAPLDAPGDHWFDFTEQPPAAVAQQIVTELARPEPWALIDGWPVLGA